VEPDQEPFNFSLATQSGQSEIFVTVANLGETVEIQANVGVSSGFLAELDVTPITISPQHLDEARAVLAGTREVADTVVGLICEECEDFIERQLSLAQAAVVRANARTQFPIPREIVDHLDVSRPRYRSLDRLVASRVATRFATGEHALLATAYLREAKQKRGTRFRWVAATTAAELAVKEVLVRLEPKLESVLLTIQSPPLRELYGPALHAFGGEVSPFVSQLHKGTETRNKLIHRFKGSPTPSFSDTDEYVRIVQKAIRHLLQVLYRRPPDSSDIILTLPPPPPPPRS
jgi:hypothetical protein